MKALLIVLSLSFSLNTFAKGGDEVRNGGGLIEQYFSYALKILPHAIDRCLSSLTCAKDYAQKDLLRKIKNSHQLESDAGILKFYLTHPTSDFFIINGVERLAFTGNFIGSPIYYNTKMLYRKGDARIELGLAVQSLIHELGHHHGVVDHDSLELLGSEVRKMVDGISMELPYFVQRRESPFKFNAFTVLAIGREVIEHKDTGTLNLLFKDVTVDAGYLVNSVLKKCDFSIEKPIVYSSMQFFNLHWDFKPDEITSAYKYLSGNINLFCKDQYSRVHKKVFKFDMKIKVSTDGNYTYQSIELLEEPKLIFTENIKLLRDR